MPRPSRWPRLVKVYLAAAQADALKSVAIREGVPASDIARRAIAAELNRINTRK